MFKKLAFAAILTAPLFAGVAYAGSVNETVTVTATNSVAGVGNFGTTTVENIGNGSIFYGGKGSVSKNVRVNTVNDVAGYYNEGHAYTGNVGNGDITVKPHRFQRTERR